MSLPGLSLFALVPLFLTGAVLVWFAGARLAGYADTISQRSGIGQATIGVILLGAVTSLPEITTTSVAVISDNPRMAVNNLVGGVAFQVVVIALADLFVGKNALSSMVPGPRVMLNAAVSIVLLVLVALGVMVGDWELWGIGVGFFPVLIATTYLLCLWRLGRSVSSRGWTPEALPEVDRQEEAPSELSNVRLVGVTVTAAVLICAGGTLVTLAAEGMAEQTGTDTGVMGLTLLAFATSARTQHGNCRGSHPPCGIGYWRYIGRKHVRCDTGPADRYLGGGSARTQSGRSQRDGGRAPRHIADHAGPDRPARTAGQGHAPHGLRFNRRACRL